MGIINRLANLFRTERLASDADDELAFHLEQRTQHYRAQGLEEAAASAAAHRNLGNLTRLHEETVESDVLQWLDALRRDAKLAVRTLRKSPFFTAVVILSLALGLGANTMVFTVAKHVLLDTLPVPDADRLVLLQSIGRQEGHVSGDGSNSSFSYPQYQDLDRGTRSVFTGILARLSRRVNLDRRSGSDRISCELVSGNYFSLLGVQPWRGRLLTGHDNEKPGAHPVAVISYGAWQRLFGADPAILNTTIRLNSLPFTVVGIAGPQFYGVQIDSPADVFVPMMMKVQMTPTWDGLNDRLDHWATLFAKLKPGVSLAQARSALSVLYLPIRDLDYTVIKSPSAGFRRDFSHTHVELVPGGKGYAAIRESLDKPLQFLSAMVLVVLLITVVNVANLLIARTSAKQRDVAVRLSIGAGQFSVIRQVLVESLLLSLIGGAAGILLAYTATPQLIRLLSTELSESSINAHPDAVLLLALSGATVLIGIAFGLLPALHSARTSPAIVLKEGGTASSPGHLWIRRLLVGGQIALSLLLLTSALLFSRSLANIQHISPGFRTDHLITFQVDPVSAGYSQARIQSFADDLLNRLRATPGFTHASVATIRVLDHSSWGSDTTVEGSKRTGPDETNVLLNAVSSDYFETFGIDREQGRTIGEHDEGQHVVVVNTAFANHFLPGQNVVGRHLSFGSTNGQLEWTIIGVVADTQHTELRGKIGPFVWRPYRSSKKLTDLTFYIRTTGSETAALQQVRQILHSVDPSLSLFDLKTMDQNIQEQLFAERGLAALANGFAILAILLAAVGLYGVVNYSVVRRQREFGIKMAIGATPRMVWLSVLRETAALGGISLLCALPLVFAFGRALRSTLYGVRPDDPILCAGAFLTLFAVALLAGWLPAREAAHIDPQVALRSS